MKTNVTNPILKGFNPDPSIIQVADDYYIATSTFEWFPGVQIHHSKDLKNWELVTRPLRRTEQLDLLGVPDSCGVWAPCLSYDKGIFYLVYSNVKSFDGTWKDTPNYLVTTNVITGEWSDPVFLDASGFDGSLFHDEDGRKWYLSMLVDHRGGKFFGGIVMREYDVEKQQLIGETYRIHEGTELGCTEGPHLYRKDGYYYLLLAEGGTEYGHAMTIHRSKNIFGPYDACPNNPIVTCSSSPDLPLQKSGHGDFVQTNSGEWYTVFLVGRPLTRRGRCTLGRETAIQRIRWDEGKWPELWQGGNEPDLAITIDTDHAYSGDHLSAAVHIRDDFEGRYDINFQSLRVPMTDDWVSLDARKGYLRLTGRESLSSCHRQSMVARRVQSHQIMASTILEFEPENFQQMAGLVCYYNTSHFHYLCISGGDEPGEKLLNIVSCDKFKFTEQSEHAIDLTGQARIGLKVEFNHDQIQFFYAVDNVNWNKVGPVLDGSILSDDYVQEMDGRYRPAFTGAFVGMACQDLSGRKAVADFDWFEYQELHAEKDGLIVNKKSLTNELLTR